MKPKYSPYNKLQRSPSILAVSIFISHRCVYEFVTLGTPTTETGADLMLPQDFFPNSLSLHGDQV